MRRNPVTRKVETSKTSKDRDVVLDWLHALDPRGAVEAVRARAGEGRTFASLGDEWLEGVKSGHIARRRRGKPEPYAPTTIPTYERDLERLLKPAFGDRPAASISEQEWQRFLDDLAHRGLSYSRLANIRAVASSIYAWAAHRTRRYVPSNPLVYVELPPNQGERRTRVALAEEAAALLAALKPADRVAYALAFYAGMRRGEIHRMLWSDVEFRDGKPGEWLRVSAAPGKAGEGRRIPMAEPLRGILLEAFINQGRPADGKVSASSVMSGKIAERARKAWDEHDLADITLHECRHTYASYLMAAGYPLAEIMEFMGHADLITTDRYVKVLPQPDEADRSDRLNAYFRRAEHSPAE